MRWKFFLAIGASEKISITIFIKYFLLTIICKIIKDFLILYDKTYVKVFINLQDTRSKI